MQQARESVGTAMSVPKPKVLICSIDGGWFGVRADWVESVSPRGNATAQTIRTADDKVVRYVVCQGEPALVVEMRALTGLESDGGRARRKQFLLVRSAQYLLAVPIDNCIGVRVIDLDSRAPVATKIRRDGGLPLGHVVEADGRMLVILDPARLLDNTSRAAWPQITRRMELLNRRIAKCDAAWQAIRSNAGATADDVRGLSSLCGRTGRPATAAAARAVLPHFAADAGDTAIASLLVLGREQRSGRFVAARDAGPEIVLTLANGGIADPRAGRVSLIQLLSGEPVRHRFEESAAPATAGGDAASVASVLIEAAEAASAEGRSR